MQLYSIVIQFEEDQLHVTVEDDLLDVKAGIESTTHKHINIECYNDDIVEIQVDKLGIYSDPNAKFSLLFNRKGKFVGFYQSDYYTENDIVMFNFLDKSFNGVEFDVCNEVIFKLSTEHITLKPIIQDDNTDLWATLHRGTLKSEVGEWEIAYIEMSMPFIPVMCVLKPWADKIPYDFENLNLFTETAIGNVIEYEQTI